MKYLESDVMWYISLSTVVYLLYSLTKLALAGAYEPLHEEEHQISASSLSQIHTFN